MTLITGVPQKMPSPASWWGVSLCVGGCPAGSGDPGRCNSCRGVTLHWQAYLAGDAGISAEAGVSKADLVAEGHAGVGYAGHP